MKSFEKIQCPQCHRYFREDYFDKYVMGTVTNTLKFGTFASCWLAGNTLGSFLGTTGARLGGKAGTELAKNMGCGTENMDGWKHHCPYCKHKW